MAADFAYGRAVTAVTAVATGFATIASIARDGQVSDNIGEQKEEMPLASAA
ncbi:TPA: hypothetical protein QDC29_005578 [Burkholderia aenigmatica]|uniref:hypothetical protein n=1 Tax=Burkholderia sp. AU45251 TaxID=3059204 RepID=UPI002652B840|nr:hypothetical protein [Burkholderia sp. AU45251]HDR9487460.1 hypothetical protein [Burkholderia aenigmatica]MDN7521185.1 hypothetical protein [Burkholderia sp. AU45251]HDR9518835.1 hypothetical protein [Burkholderia aenigmatica]HDR9595702.1 hypothetical protein [Burkholderia aenigmatica]HDR9602565.1 hypothetical protein [Burkholderia aenigmatica]